MTIQEVALSLNDIYAAKPYPHKVMGVTVHSDVISEFLRIDIVNQPFTYGYIPPESKPGVGYETYRCTGQRGQVTVSDSGVIAP